MIINSKIQVDNKNSKIQADNKSSKIQVGNNNKNNKKRANNKNSKIQGDIEKRKVLVLLGDCRRIISDFPFFYLIHTAPFNPLPEC